MTGKISSSKISLSVGKSEHLVELNSAVAEGLVEETPTVAKGLGEGVLTGTV